MPGYMRKLGNCKYRLYVSNGFRPDGKPNRASKVVEAASDRAAQKLLDALYLEFCKKPPQVNTRITFKAFVGVWWERHGNKLSPNGYVTNKSLLDKRLIPHFGLVKLKKIDATMISNYFEELRLNGKCLNKEEQLSSGAIFNIYRFLRALFNKAVEWGYLSSNPCNDIPKDNRPKPDFRKPSILEANELEIFLKQLFALPDNPTNTKHKLFCYLGLLDGARLGEHTALTWSDIDMENKVIHITKATYYKEKTAGIKAPKTKSSERDVYFDEVVLQLLRKHKRNQEAWLVKHGLANPNGYLFLKRDTKSVSLPTRSMFFHWLDGFLKRIHLPHFGVHGLRRMAASYSANSNVPLTAIQAMLGHTEISTTNIYLRSLIKGRRDGTELMSKRFQDMIGTDTKTDEDTNN